MSAMVVMLLAAAASAAPPIELATSLERDTLRVVFRLMEPLPEALDSALPSGAEVAVRYQIRLRSSRKIWWPRKLWKGEAVAAATFDPVIGRFRCELVLDGVIVTSREIESLDEARRWLVEPEPVRFAMPEGPLKGVLKVRVRAVFSSSTKWLFFPDTDGTRWVEVPIATASAADRQPTEAPDE